MIIQPYSFGGTLLQSTDYETSIPRQSALAQLEANLVYVKRAGASPLYSGKDFQPVVLNLEVKMLHDFMTTLESLNQLFDIYDETPREFVIQDTEDSNKQYYVYATPKQVLGGHDGQMAVVVLGFDDPVWQSSTQNSQTWNITASGDSTSVTNSGNTKAYPIFEIAVTGYPATGWVYNNFVEYTPSASSSGWANRPLELLGDTNGIGLNTAALVTANKAQASGNDFRVLVDGIEVDHWFGGSGFNTTDTRCWININQPTSGVLKLKTAIAATDTSTSVEFIYTSAYKKTFTAMPTRGRFKINSEEFTYRSKTINNTRLRANGVTRSVRNTSAAAHASSDTVTWIPYDINLIYGSSDAPAPDVDDTYKPVLNLTTSYNGSLIYAAFKDFDSLRSGIWSPQIASVSNARRSVTKLYTGVNDGGDTNPADVAGMMIGAFQAGGVWKPETSTLYWQLYVPDGISTIAFSYERYQYNASTPATIGVQTSTDGVSWTNGKTYTTVASTDYQSWVTGSAATSDVTVTTGAKYARATMAGTVTAVANNKVYFGLTGATINTSNPPTLSRRGEQSNYQFNATLTNTTTGESMKVDYSLKIGDTLTIDTDPNFPTATLNDQIVNGIISTDTIRADWLSLTPGANTLTFTSDYAVGTVTITVKWRDRMNYL